MGAVLLADDAYSFIVAREAMALTSYFLVTTQHRIPEIRQAERHRDEPPPPAGLAEQIERNAQHAVDRGLQHHAAHERRHRRRRRGMRFGQPDVHRHDAGLGAEAEQREQESGRCPTRRQLRRAHRVERELPAAALQHAEREQDADRAEVRDQQIEEARLPDFGDAMLGRDEEVRRQRHRLPRDHERVGVVGEQHGAHRREKQWYCRQSSPGSVPSPRRK